MTFCHVFITFPEVWKCLQLKKTHLAKKVKSFYHSIMIYAQRSFYPSLARERSIAFCVNQQINRDRKTFYFFRRNSPFRLIPLYSRIFPRAFCTITHCPSPYNMIDMRYSTRYYLQASSIALSFIFKNSIGYLDKRLSSHILTSYNLSCFVNHEFLGP